MSKEERLVKWFSSEENCRYYNQNISKKVGRKLIKRSWNTTKTVALVLLLVLIVLSIISSIALGYPVEINSESLNNIGSLITVKLAIDKDSADYLVDAVYEKIKEVQNG